MVFFCSTSPWLVHHVQSQRHSWTCFSISVDGTEEMPRSSSLGGHDGIIIEVRTVLSSSGQSCRESFWCKSHIHGEPSICGLHQQILRSAFSPNESSIRKSKGRKPEVPHGPQVSARRQHCRSGRRGRRQGDGIFTRKATMTLEIGRDTNPGETPGFSGQRDVHPQARMNMEEWW